MRFALLLLSCSLLAQESRFSTGVTGGFSFSSNATRPFGTYNQESRNYAIGPRFEFRFTDHISVVVNPLYRRLGASSNFERFPQLGSATQTTDFADRVRSHNLSIPILGKYSFGSPQRTWRPFVTTGFELNQSWNYNDTRQTRRDSATGMVNTSSFGFSSRPGFNSGVVVGGGIDRKWNRLHFTPEFRYTFQNPTNNTVEGRHKADLLVSIRF